MFSQQIEKERVIAGEKTSQNMPLLPQYTLGQVRFCQSFSYSLCAANKAVYWTRDS